MKILHVIPGLETGGAETQLCRLVESLRLPRYEHTIVVLGNEGALTARAVEAGAKIVHLGMKRGHLNSGAAYQLWRLLRLERPDVVHGWMYKANVAATLAAFGRGVPLLWGIRSSLTLKNKSLPTRIMIRLGAPLSRQVRRILYNSSAGAYQHEVVGYRHDRTLVIPNGFDTAEFRPDAERRRLVRSELGLLPESFVIGLIARLHPMKDHDGFLRAASLFAKRCSKAMFLLVGEGLTPENKSLVDLLCELGLFERVRLCGRRNDVASINAALDVACCSSWTEGFPNAIGEAMACGVPCVGTDVGDMRHIIGETGIVVPPRDAGALCAGWAKLEEMDVACRRSLGVEARQRVIERFSLAAVARQYGELYQKLGQH